MADDAADTDRFVEVSGLRLRYRRMGQGAPVVVIHGAGGNLGDWTAGPAQAIATGFDVTVFDRPGLGMSGWPEDYADIFTQARLLRSASEAIGIRNPIVIGHSYGGAVALAWAVDSPQTVSGLLLIAAVSEVWSTPGGIGALNQVMAVPVAGSAVAWILPRLATPAYVSRRLDEVFWPQSAPPGYLDDLNPALILNAGTLRRNAVQLLNLKAQVARAVPRYQDALRMVPIELLHGTADRIVSPAIHSQVFAEQVPHARLTLLPGIGHMPHHVAPEEMLAALDRLTRPHAPPL